MILGPDIHTDAEQTLNRRRFCGQALAATVGTGWLMRSTATWAEEATTPADKSGMRYKIGICDWMILKRQRLGAFQLTKDIGADGVEVDMGSLGQRETFENAL